MRRKTGYLPGDARFYTRLTGRRQLELLASLRGMPAGTAGARPYDELAERLRLPLDRRIRGYSKGMRQKLGIIQAVMHAPSLIVLDEPTSALDPLVQDDVHQLLLELRDRGSAIFFSSHVLSEVQKVCDRVALVREGKLLREASVDGMEELEIYRATVRCGASERLAERLRAEGFAPEPVAGGLALTAQGREDRLTELLAQHPAPLERLRVEPLSLEEVFLELYRSGPATASRAGSASP